MNKINYFYPTIQGAPSLIPITNLTTDGKKNLSFIISLIIGTIIDENDPNAITYQCFLNDEILVSQGNFSMPEELIQRNSFGEYLVPTVINLTINNVNQNQRSKFTFKISKNGKLLDSSETYLIYT
ncbi:hypothetical protein [Lactococcus cremoris]|uniref:hypothetical protein n=1 Tax=Lactococcus lactis subsp. cremoris TaxID=1359 RepID=UPI002FC5CE0E